MFSLFVSLQIRSDRREQFLQAISVQAASPLSEEPGCLRFDVCKDRDDEDHFLLYEIYDEAESFAQHKKTPHFARWREAADACVADQVNTETELLFVDD